MTRKIHNLILGGFLCLSTMAHSEISPDQKCLANAIFHEAGGEPLKGQYAVGEVIVNRFNAGLAKSICSVINQHKGTHWQFGFNQTGNKPIPREHKEYFFTVALAILNRKEHFILPRNVLYFNNRKFKGRKFKLFCQIGKQKFYTLT
jgi:hypothetical protein